MDEQQNTGPEVQPEEAQQKTFTIAEAAALLGVTRQTIYNRLKNIVKEDRERFTVLQGRTLYVTRAFIEVVKLSNSQIDSQTEELDSQLDKPFDKPVKAASKTIRALQAEIDNLTSQLREAQGKASSLQATVEAQQAHIDSLKRALDGEQALHMAALQQRLPAGRGEGFFTWIKGKLAKQRDTNNQ